MDGREVEALGEEVHELFAVVGDAAAAAAEGERRTQNEWEPELAAEFKTVFEIVYEGGAWDVEANLRHRVFEEEAVFGLLDGAELGADEDDVVLVEDAAVGEIDGEVEGSLAADGGQYGELAGLALHHFRLDANDFFEIVRGERLDIGAVGHLGVGHDGGRVRVGEHDFVAFGLECFAGLRTGVVEFGGLADDDRAGADDEDLGDVVTTRHLLVGLSLWRSLAARPEWIQWYDVGVVARDIRRSG